VGQITPLSLGVDMTSAVQGCSKIFYTFITGAQFFMPSIGRGGASQRRRLIMLISVDWRPPLDSHVCRVH
jgi:hypothetical protein